MIKITSDLTEEFIHYEVKSNGDHLLFANVIKVVTVCFMGIPVYKKHHKYKITKLPEFKELKSPIGY